MGASNHNLIIARTVVTTRTKDIPSQGNSLSLSPPHPPLSPPVPLSLPQTHTQMLQKDLLHQDGRNDEKIVIQK